MSTESTTKRAHASRFLTSPESQCIYPRKDVPKTIPRAEHHSAHARSRYSLLDHRVCKNVLFLAFYIHRFAHQLGFGDSGTKNKEVMETSNRIVQRMNRDWMTEGRRPAGICGAAFVIAARMHGFKCNIEDITKVFKIGPNTIRKRLHEFGATPSAKLTIDEFNRIDLESEFDPPSFIKAQEEAARKFDNEEIDRQVTEAEALIPEIDQAMTEDQKKAASKRKRRPKKADHTADDIPR